MKYLPILFCLFFTIFSLPTCEKQQHIRPALLEVEALVDSLPEEAYKRLTADTFDMDNANEAERMKYALLKNKAEDKLFRPHTNDSLMKTVLEYYKKKGTQEEQMEAYYQLAGTYRDMHDAPQAIDCYTQAMIIGEEHSTSAHKGILGRIYAELAWQLDNQGKTRQALEIVRKKSRLYNDSDYYSLHELGTAYRQDGQRDSALYYLKAARMALARQQHVDTAEMLSIYGSGLVQGMKMKDSSTAKECYEKLRNFGNDALTALALTGKSYYFEGINEDSFKTNLEAAYRKDNVIERRMAHATRLSHFYYQKGDLRTAMYYALARDSMYEVFSVELEHRQASDAYSQYIYERNERQKQEIQKAHLTAERNYAIFAAFLTITIIFGYFGFKIFKYYRSSNRELAQKVEELTIDKDALQKESHHNIELYTKINGEQLRRQLHQQAEKGQKEPIITQDLLDQVIALVTAEAPDFYAFTTTHKDVLKNIDLMILYLKKIGMNQSETARLLGRTRSTICHRLTVLGEEFGDIIDRMEPLRSKSSSADDENSES